MTKELTAAAIEKYIEMMSWTSAEGRLDVAVQIAKDSGELQTLLRTKVEGEAATKTDESRAVNL